MAAAASSPQAVPHRGHLVLVACSPAGCQGPVLVSSLTGEQKELEGFSCKAKVAYDAAGWAYIWEEQKVKWAKETLASIT
eukprot:5868893-Lingulodinium_polyedra.AAC.1